MGCCFSVYDDEGSQGRPPPLRYPEEFHPFEVQLIKDECMRASACVAGKRRHFETQAEVRERKIREHTYRREKHRWENGMDVIPEDQRWRKQMPTIPEHARYNGKSKPSANYVKRRRSFREDRYPRMGAI